MNVISMLRQSRKQFVTFFFELFILLCDGFASKDRVFIGADLVCDKSGLACVLKLVDEYWMLTAFQLRVKYMVKFNF
jgi:hypothetical protein